MYRLIIVDDNKLSADALSRLPIWEELDCRIECVCYDSIEGKDAILKYKPDIIISDIRMPGLDGLELIRIIQEEIPDAKVIFISAYDQFSYAQEALRLKAQDYLVKPFTKEMMKNAVQKVIALLDEEKSRARETDPDSEHPVIQPIIRYMEETIEQNVTAEDTAQHFFMSVSRLNSLLHKYKGKGFGKLRIELKMKKARELILDVRYNIDEISRQIGYVNYASFYRAFSREYGISPTEYREECLRMNQKDDVTDEN